MLQHTRDGMIIVVSTGKYATSKTPILSVNIVLMLRKEYADLPIFAGLEPQQFQLIMPFLEEAHYPENTVIFEQGQIADCLYILLEGEVHVRYKPYDGPPLTVARIMPGGVFGWSAALGRDIYTSAAICVLSATAFRLRGEYLQQLCDCHPDTGGILLERLARVIAERMRNTHPQILKILAEGVDPTGKCKPRSEDDERIKSGIFTERAPGSLDRDP